MNFILYLLIPIIAFLYASVGFGGATGYLAAMSLFGIPPQEMATTALVLNILVSSISFSSFYRAGHLRRDLLLPFVAASVPAAFIGGYFKITDEIYSILLYGVLTFVAVRLLFFSTRRDMEDEIRAHYRLPISYYPLAFLIGFLIGLLSGMIGIGGGIFLSPIIIFAKWGNAKQASAVAAAFIALNSISGVAGRVSGGTLEFTAFGMSLLPFGLAGALMGSYWGAVRFNGLHLRRALGLVMSFAVTNFWWTLWR